MNWIDETKRDFLKLQPRVVQSDDNNNQIYYIMKYYTWKLHDVTV